MTEPDNTVAVVGMALRVPGAADPRTFWSNLIDGRVSVPAAARDEHGDGQLVAGQIDRFQEFDAELFGVLPSHAAATDPQHRVLTELVWEALEDAGLDTQRSQDKVGVFVGCGPDAYLHGHVRPDESVVRALGEEQLQVGNSRDFLATALSYRLGFTGPSLTVQTACSTSLVAVHQAVRSLLTYECDIAVAGGCTIHPAEQPPYSYVEGGIVSADGLCRPFTSGSKGTVPSSGAGVVVLRRAGEADAPGAPGTARAYILGSAVNNDGADRMSLTAPSPRGQAEVIREALETAGLDAGDIGYVETHGTGTALGDQIELAALAEVYGTGESTAPLALGTVKPNVGHCDTAAGVIGLIKTVLAVEHGVIPPAPPQPGDGPVVDLGSARFRLPRQARPWDATAPQAAAVSSFGLGGTNAHVVVGRATTAPPAPAGDGGHRVAVLSAATGQALRDKAGTVAEWLDGAGAATPLPDVLGALWHGRRRLRHRLAVDLPGGEAEARAELRDALRSLAADGDGHRAEPDPTVAVVLPGQGVRLAGVGAELLAAEPEFAADVAELHRTVLRVGGPDLRDCAHWQDDDPRLLDTSVVQPMLFVLGLAAMRLLDRRGAGPRVLLGHSIGELTAAAHAGVFTPEDAAAAVVQRGRLMAAAPAGAMLAVRAGEDTARRLLTGLTADVCGLNGPDSTVLGGDLDTVAELERRCRAEGLTAKRLATSHAFHSRAMDEAATAFEEFLRGCELSAPQLMVISNLTGAALTADQARDPGYWARQLRSTVRFGEAMNTLAAAKPQVVVGLHRGPSTTDPVRQILRRLGVPAPVTDMLGSRTRSEARAYEATLATLWTIGCPVRVDVPHPRQAVRLPAYPFAPTRHWIDAPAAPPSASDAPSATTAPQPRATTAAASPDAAGAAVASGTEPAGDDIAASVTGIWQAAFGGPALRSTDNFFSLGGTSLQAAHLVVQVNDTLLTSVSLADLYENSTLGGFTARVEELLRLRDDDELLRLLDEIEAAR